MALHSTSSNVTADLTANAERDGAASSDATSIRSVPVGSLASMTARQVLMNDGAGSLIAASVADGLGTGDVSSDMLASGAAATNIGAGGVTSTMLNSAVAGNGLTGGGGSALAVGAGTGISVAADSVGIANSGVNTNQIAGDAVTGAKISTNAFVSAVTTGRNGTGAVTVAAAPLNAVVKSVLYVSAGQITSGAGSFESTISVAGQIQQTDAADLSTTSFFFELQSR